MESGTLVSAIIIPQRPTISAKYLSTKVGANAFQSSSFSPLAKAIKVNIIKPMLIKINIICAGDKKVPDILINISPRANNNIERSIRSMPLVFF